VDGSEQIVSGARLHPVVGSATGSDILTADPLADIPQEDIDRATDANGSFGSECLGSVAIRRSGQSGLSTWL
jgi:hypothetical protein